MVLVDMEDADGQSPKEGSRGSKRKSKREVRCMQFKRIGASQLELTHFLSLPFSPAQNLMKKMLLLSMPSKLAALQTFFQGPMTWLTSMRLLESDA